MGIERLKPGDKVMFLGIYDNEPHSMYWAARDSLVPMRVYVVRGVRLSQRYSISLLGIRARHRNKYFQKVEEKL